MNTTEESPKKQTAFEFLTNLKDSKKITENQQVLLDLLSIGQQYEQKSRFSEKQRSERRRKTKEARLSRKLNRR